MDIAWKGMLTCDYERSRPHASQLERELYTRSLTTWPSVFLGEPSPYGTLRRPGIVDIRQEDHDRLTGQLHACLASPHRALDLAEQATAHRRQASAALRRAETRPASGCLDRSPWTASVAAASTAILPVMSAHIVNWLLPEEQWETRMTKLLGNRASARACIAALSLPASPGHLLARLTTKATETTAGNHLLTAQRSAVETRESWIDAVILAAAGDAPALDAVRAMIITLEWAAESEERRRELRERYLALTTAWCADMGLGPRTVTLADISAMSSTR